MLRRQLRRRWPVMLPSQELIELELLSEWNGPPQ
jgi:hypothetical protein